MMPEVYRMIGEPIDVITISREYGSGGSDLAREVGARLHWPVLDRDLLQQVAERLSLSHGTVEAMDEHPPSLLARIASGLLIAPVESPLTFDTNDILSPDAIAHAARAAIQEAVEKPPLIVVGHGTQTLFQNRPGTLHVRLVAPLDQRVERVCARQQGDPRIVAGQARRMDQDRAAYVRRYYRSDWHDALLYDLQLNTGRISIDEAATTVTELVRARNLPPSKE